MKVLMMTDREQLSPRLQNEVETLIDRGHQLTVAYFRGEDRSGGDANRERYDQCYIPVGAPTGSALLFAVLPLIYFRFFIRLRSRKVDVIHCAQLYLLPIALMLARLQRAKVVYDAYEMHALSWSRYSPYFSRALQRLFEA